MEEKNEKKSPAKPSPEEIAEIFEKMKGQPLPKDTPMFREFIPVPNRFDGFEEGGEE